MRKYSWIVTILVLFSSVIGCSSTIGKNEKVDENSYKANNKKSVITNSIISESTAPALASFLGEWKTTKRLIIPRVNSKEELKRINIIGDKVIIKSNIFSIARLQYKNPNYKVSNITHDEFGEENIGTFANGSLSKLNIYDKSTITKLDVFPDKSLEFPIITLYLDDKNTIIANANYIAMYELKRIKSK